jgi:phospholipid/cholesterol/gamma-HCH transport system substrate-binding protein
VPPDIFESFEALGEVIGEEGGSIRKIIDDLSTIIGDLREGDLSGNLNRGVESIANAGESIERLTAQVERGEGTVGQLFQSDELFDNWNSVGANLDELLVTAREGDGVIGRLVSDTELGARVDETVGEIRGAAGNIRELTAGVTGSGSVVDRILHDEQLGADLSGIGTDLRSLSGRLANADGTIARLIDRPELYDTFLAAGEDVRSITSQVASGEGTLGRLIYSDEIYDEVALAIRTANRGLEDYREAAPITTFTNLIFAGF